MDMENKTLNSPVRIQRSRQHKQVSPNGLAIKYVGRGTRWGNPFRLVKYSDGKWAIKTDGSDKCADILINNCHFVYDTRNEAAIDAIKCYTLWLVPDNIVSLKGHNLSCWCRLDQKCHADVLLELATL